jgi:hypothetical protein
MNYIPPFNKYLLLKLAALGTVSCLAVMNGF